MDTLELIRTFREVNNAALRALLAFLESRWRKE
jgi:hypothetical protein